LGLYKRAKASGIPFNGPEDSIDTPELRQTLRTAAADSIVLLKNDKGLLPLTKPKKIAIIGPNAKYAMTSGGGSARLLSSYTVSPLQGISAAAREVGAEVEYALGATSHKYLPLLDPFIHLKDGTPGALLEFWNESPSTDFADSSADLSKELPACAWETVTAGSNCILLDGIVSCFRLPPSTSLMFATIGCDESQLPMLDTSEYLLDFVESQLTRVIVFSNFCSG